MVSFERFRASGLIVHNENESVCTEAYSSSIGRLEGKRSSSNPPPFYVQDASRRDLRKTFERQGVSAPNEGDFLVLCDSIDPERQGRVRISDVRGKLELGMAVGSEVGSDREVGQGTDSRTACAAAFPGITCFTLSYELGLSQASPPLKYRMREKSIYQVDVLHIIYDKETPRPLMPVCPPPHACFSVTLMVARARRPQQPPPRQPPWRNCEVWYTRPNARGVSISSSHLSTSTGVGR